MALGSCGSPHQPLWCQTPGNQNKTSWRTKQNMWTKGATMHCFPCKHPRTNMVICLSTLATKYGVNVYYTFVKVNLKLPLDESHYWSEATLRSPATHWMTHSLSISWRPSCALYPRCPMMKAPPMMATTTWDCGPLRRGSWVIFQRHLKRHNFIPGFLWQEVWRKILCIVRIYEWRIDSIHSTLHQYGLNRFVLQTSWVECAGSQPSWAQGRLLVLAKNIFTLSVAPELLHPSPGPLLVPDEIQNAMTATPIPWFR